MTTNKPALRQTISVVVLLAGVWTIAALVRPESTFHLGPLLLPLAPLLVAQRGRQALLGVGIGAAAGLVTIVVLAVTGSLDGPAFEPFPSALTESVIVLAGATAVGVAFAAITGRSVENRI